VLSGHVLEDGGLMLAPVAIGAGATVGFGTVISAGAALDENVHLLPRTVVPPGASLPPASSWEGAPARRAAQAASGMAMLPHRATAQMTRAQLVSRRTLRDLGGDSRGMLSTAAMKGMLCHRARSLALGVTLMTLSATPGMLATLWAWKVRNEPCCARVFVSPGSCAPPPAHARRMATGC